MDTRWRAFARALGFLFWCSAAAAGADDAARELPDRLSLETAVAIFRARGFDLLLAEAAVDSARGDLASAGQVPNPSLSLGAGRVFHYDPTVEGCVGCSRDVWQAGISDQGALFDLVIGKRRLRVDVARAALEAARLGRVDAERTLVALVKQTWVQGAVAQAALRAAGENAAASAETDRIVGLRYAAGAVSEADAARAETAKLEAEQAVDAAVQALASAKASLSFLLAVRGDVPDFTLDETPLEGSHVPERLATPALLEAAYERRPDLAAARALVTSAESALVLAKRQVVPDTAVSAAYTQTGTGQNAIQPPTLTFGLSFSPPVFYRQKGEIRKAEANLAAQRLNLDKALARVDSDVATAAAAFDAARRRLGRMESRLLDRSRRARDLVGIQYEKGAASLLELLDAQRTFLATRTEYLQNLNDAWAALFQLEQAAATEICP